MTGKSVDTLSCDEVNHWIAKGLDIKLTPDGYIEYVIDHLNSDFKKFDPARDIVQCMETLEIYRSYRILKFNNQYMVSVLHESSTGNTLTLAAMRAVVKLLYGDTV